MGEDVNADNKHLLADHPQSGADEPHTVRFDVVGEATFSGRETPSSAGHPSHDAGSPALFRAQIMAAPPQERRAALEGWLMGWIAERLPIAAEGIQATASLIALGMDSITAMELKTHVEDVLGVDLSVNDYMSIASVRDLVERLLADLPDDALVREALAELEGERDEG